MISTDLDSDSGVKNGKKNLTVPDKSSIVLSEYGESLESHVKCRYIEKIVYPDLMAESHLLLRSIDRSSTVSP